MGAVDSPKSNVVQLFQDIPIQDITLVSMTLNENPLYLDEKGNCVINEPKYQLVIRLKAKPSFPDTILYDYFDSPTEEEAVLYIHRLKGNLHHLGLKKITIPALSITR